MTELQLLTTKEAAEYCGVPLTYFRLQIKRGGGPVYIMPSARRRYFKTSDLETWMAEWKRGRGPMNRVTNDSITNK